MYSQSNEEEYILKYLPDFGTFWDIGAYDGKTFSNTLALLERGWVGVAVEASPYNLINLRENTKQHTDRLQYLMAAITYGDAGLTAWYETNGDAISTTEADHKAKWERSGYKFSKMYVASLHWDVLNSMLPNPDFINVDVEGNSALLAIDMWHEGIKPQMWCIEHDGRADELAAMFMGYQEVMRNSENVLLLRR